jgi:hypothetical protein
VDTRDLRTLWSPPVSLNQERHTQRRKAVNFIFILFICCDENPLKVPHENIHGEASILENFQKKTKSPHFQEGKKNSFEITTFWGEKKQVLKSLRFVEDLGRFQVFFFWNVFMKGVLTLTPLPPRRTTRWTDTWNIIYSGYPWPSGTMKSPGFFKLGSCFSFF